MPKQVDKYTNERQDVLNKMFSILGINEHNNTFLLHELDSNIDKQSQILQLEPDIKKYFLCGKWNCFTDPNIKRKYLSLIKNTVKTMGYSIISARRNVKIDDKIIGAVVYHITKNTI